MNGFVWKGEESQYIYIELGHRNPVVIFILVYTGWHSKLKWIGALKYGSELKLECWALSGVTGLVGCVREVEVNGEPLEPRYVVRSGHKKGQVSLDNCQLVDPCKRPDACKHGGKCSVKDDSVTCDCEGTGYIGKNCFFG